MTMPVDPQKLIFDEKLKDVPLSNIKDTVVVYVEGGPTHDVGADGLITINEGLVAHGLKNYSLVAARQAHNINPTVFGSGTTFTDANAQEVNNQTINILEKVITWLKSNNKVVYLFGHSNGSFMVQNYLSTGKINPNGYVISGTRLKRVQAFFDNYPNNIDISFIDGVTVVPKNITPSELPYFNVMTKLQLNHMKDYKSLLVGKSILSKTVYSLAGKDQAVGRIEKDENDFLTNNKVPYILNADADHGGAAVGVLTALVFFRK